MWRDWLGVESLERISTDHELGSCPRLTYILNPIPVVVHHISGRDDDPDPPSLIEDLNESADWRMTKTAPLTQKNFMCADLPIRLNLAYIVTDLPPFTDHSWI